MVERVERLGAELNARALVDMEILVQRHVPLLITGSADAIAIRVAGPDLTPGDVHEALRVEPLQKLMRRVGVQVADCVGARCGAAAGGENPEAARIRAERTGGGIER